MPAPQNEKARRALPFAAGFPLVAYLRYYRGDRNLFHQIDVGSPPALSPSLAGSQRIGGREAADPLTSDKFQFVDDAESTKSGSRSARRFFISSRRSFNRRNFKRLNFARVAFAARNSSFKFVNVPISALLNGAAAAKNHPAMTRPGSSLATTVPPPVVGLPPSEPLLFSRITGGKVDDKRAYTRRDARYG